MQRTTRSIPRIHIFAALFLASVLSIGCSSSHSKTGGGESVQVILDEYKISMPTTFPAGQTTFNITNTGEHKHGFKIKGNGIEQELTSGLASMESGELTATLVAGTYEVSCPMLGHSLLGMHLTVIATPR